MEITEVRQESREVQTGTKCDYCGKEVKGVYPKTWHHFDSHHSDWGNDSRESYEYFDVCSPRCFIEIARKQMNDGVGFNKPEERSTTQISDFNEQFLFELLKLLP